MVFKKGDFVTFDYMAKIKEEDKVFDTSIEQVAETAKIKRNGANYVPILNIIGEGWFLKPIDDAFLNMKLNETSLIEVAPKDAFGERDPEKVKVVPLSALTKQGIRPVVEMRISYGGRTAIVRSVASGRVTLDSNQFLAGKTLVYEVTIKSVIKKDSDKIKSLIHRRFPTLDINKFRMAQSKETVLIDVPSEAVNMDGIQQAKRGIFTDVTKYFPKITVVNFLESYKVPQKVAPPVTSPPATPSKSGVDVVLKPENQKKLNTKIV